VVSLGFWPPSGAGGWRSALGRSGFKAPRRRGRARSRGAYGRRRLPWAASPIRPVRGACCATPTESRQVDRGHQEAQRLSRVARKDKPEGRTVHIFGVLTSISSACFVKIAHANSIPALALVLLGGFGRFEFQTSFDSVRNVRCKRRPIPSASRDGTEDGLVGKTRQDSRSSDGAAWRKFGCSSSCDCRGRPAEVRS
jgi:hypothetical protein